MRMSLTGASALYHVSRIHHAGIQGVMKNKDLQHIIKRVQRRYIYIKRKNIPAEQRSEKSRAVCEAVSGLECMRKLRPGDIVLSYMAFKSEADMSELHEYLRERGVRTAFPVTEENGVMHAYIPADMHSREDASVCDHGDAHSRADAPVCDREDVHGRTDVPVYDHEDRSGSEFRNLKTERPAFRISSMGISEPDTDTAEYVKPEELAAVIVPCVGFDGRRARLGHGAGYYDRYLPYCVNAVMIMAAFEEQRLNAVCESEYDLRPDMLVTDSGVQLSFGTISTTVRTLPVTVKRTSFSQK